MNKSELEMQKKDAIDIIARKYDIKGRSSMRKADLIEKILEVEKEANKAKYIGKAVVGTLIAFTLPTGKALSGMVIQLCDEAFEVETKNGRRFFVKHDNVMWVKTNGRWPRQVYNALKGVS